MQLKTLKNPTVYCKIFAGSIRASTTAIDRIAACFDKDVRDVGRIRVHSIAIPSGTDYVAQNRYIALEIDAWYLAASQSTVQ